GSTDGSSSRSPPFLFHMDSSTTRPGTSYPPRRAPPRAGRPRSADSVPQRPSRPLAASSSPLIEDSYHRPFSTAPSTPRHVTTARPCTRLDDLGIIQLALYIGSLLSTMDDMRIA